MECEFGHIDCQNLDKKCDMCYNSVWYLAPKNKPKPLQKRNYNKGNSKRMGSTFEDNNHRNNAKMIKDIVSSNMTPNSGAGRIKGDEQISGIINITEELKTQQPNRARGVNQFTIQRAWFEKLDRESKAAGKEFWYLKFAFCDSDDKSYTIIDTEQMMAMVETIIYDRKIALEADNKIDIANKRRILVEAENTVLHAKIELLEALLKQHGIKIEESE